MKAIDKTTMIGEPTIILGSSTNIKTTKYNL